MEYSLLDVTAKLPGSVCGSVHSILDRRCPITCNIFFSSPL